MIIGALISLIGLILLTIIEWLPSATAYPLDPRFSDSVASVFQLAHQWDYIFPLSSLVWLAVLFVGFWLAVFTVKVLQYIIALIRG